jgi:hypothetical protein
MNTIKGLVLISRFEYIEKNYGKSDLKQFLLEISTDTENYTKQPIVGANNYPAHTIATIDQLLLSKYFNSDVELFRKLGEWNADNFMHRFFNLYLDEQLPVDFIFQYARLRPYLIGSGEMHVTSDDKKIVDISVDYGQPVSRSVYLSEQGFLVHGTELCGARTVKLKEDTCAGLSDSMVCTYQLTIT